jgi:hypothetical protein
MVRSHRRSGIDLAMAVELVGQAIEEPDVSGFGPGFVAQFVAGKVTIDPDEAAGADPD